MNAIPDQATLSPAQMDWDAVFAEVNAWRGQCMHHFTVVEHAVTETLLALDAASPEGIVIRLRHLIGQRFEDLAAAIAPDGPFGVVSNAASTALSNFRARHEAFRTSLCHGTIWISVERSGKWVLVLRTLSIRGRQADRATEVIDEALAEVWLTELRRDGQKLTAALGQVRKAVSQTR